MVISDITLGGYPTTVSIADPATVLEWKPGRFDLLLADANTAELLPVEDTIPRVVVPAGEACKDFAVLESVLREFSRFELRRDSVIAAVGGGALTDLAALAASLYLRGISVVLIPSSLLAMVDAAVGGKTGVDFQGYKNLVGTFWPAREVRIVPELVNTLTDREYRSGLAEVIKAALLDDAELLDLLEGEDTAILDRDRAVLREMISRAVAVKCGIVSRDFTEQGERAHLNLGHTFAHALEACLGLGHWTHGDAVAWGIARAMETGIALGITDPAWARRVESLLLKYQYPIYESPVSPSELLPAMARDKKRRREGIRFVLQTGPFHTVQQTVEPAIITSVLEQTRGV